jgi:phosphoribosylglycinamide formyltransferase-1
MRVGVLASGRGSNLLALLGAFPPGHGSVQVACVFSNRPDCSALQHARSAGVAAAAFPRSRYRSRVEQQDAMAVALQSASVGLVVLAGYDQVLTSALLVPFAGRIINIHPSLLPAFSGTLHAQAAAVAYGARISGCTVHYVNEEVDEGPIIAQAAVPVYDFDTEQSLAERILEQEHRLLPAVVELIAENRVRVEGRRVVISEGAASAGITERL